MKTIVNFSIFPRMVSKMVYENLIRIHPDGKKPFSFLCWLPDDNPKVKRLLETLQNAGLTPRKIGELESKDKFALELVREYETKDIDEAQWLVFYHQHLSSHSVNRDKDGVIVLDPSMLKKQYPMAMHGRASIVSDDFKSASEKAGLVGVAFKPTGVQGGPNKVGKTGYWELTSSIVLPPLPKEELVCRNNQPFKGDYSEVVGIRGEPFYRGAELHYSQVEIEKLMTIDIARTYESFCNEPRLVVSQGFRAFCKQQKLMLEWEPVRLDP